MCDITNETDLKEAVIYKVVHKQGERYVSPFAKTTLTTGDVPQLGPNDMDEKAVIWNDNMRGRVTGFANLADARKLIRIKQPHNFGPLILVRVRVRAGNGLSIMVGTGASMSNIFNDSRVLAAPHVVSIEELDDLQANRIYSRFFL